MELGGDFQVFPAGELEPAQPEDDAGPGLVLPEDGGQECLKEFIHYH